jgi:UDP-N-acetyl-D-mannosaminuronate dehydrogenase
VQGCVGCISVKGEEMEKSDLIIGMGEVGSTIFQLLQERNINVQGVDIDIKKCKTTDKFNLDMSFDFLHICTPYTDYFVTDVMTKIASYKPNAVIVHSTVKPGTVDTISNHSNIPIFYSPVRGVHSRFLGDLKKYDKYIAPVIPKFDEDLQKRFSRIVLCDSVKSLELAKIMETTYYGYLIAFRKQVDENFEKLKLNPNVFWDFCVEINDNLNNRPVLFNDKKPIGGHCVIPNLELLPTEFQEYKNLIGKWGK